MAITKRGKFWHYEFMVDGQKYRGTTKETVKSRATTFEALGIADVRNNGRNVNLRRAPVLRDFSKRFLEFVDAQAVAGQLDLDTKSITTADGRSWMERGWRVCASIRSGPATPPSSASPTVLQRQPGLSYSAPDVADSGGLECSPGSAAHQDARRARAYGAGRILHRGVAAQARPTTFADVLVIMMDSGMRPEEVMRMRKEDIFWDRSAVLVPYGKSFKSKRYVPLSDRMRTLLRLREFGDSPWIFPSKRARGGHLTTVHKQWAATVEAVNLALAEQKLPPIPAALVPYCSRHTFGTDMLAEGLNVVEVSKLMGHTDVKTTMKYLHPDTSQGAAMSQ